MAWCPKCKKEIGQTATICPHCGHDFRSADSTEEERKGLAYSRLADIALTVVQIAALVACVLAIIAAVVALLSLQWLDTLICAVQFFIYLAVFVVFARFQDMSGKGTR